MKSPPLGLLQTENPPGILYNPCTGGEGLDIDDQYHYQLLLIMIFYHNIDIVIGTNAAENNIFSIIRSNLKFLMWYHKIKKVKM